MTEFESSLLERGEVFKHSCSSLIGNLSKIVAVITAAVAVLVTFTDVTFASLTAGDITTVMAVLLMAAYVIYFSLEDAGERLGEDSEEYKSAIAKHISLRKMITPDMIPELRRFTADYTRAEAEYRREAELIRLGYSKDEYESFLSGKITDGKSRRALARVKKISPITISVPALLSKERTKGKSELYNPERRKHIRMALRLTPSLLCMIITVSVVLSVKDGLGLVEVLEGVMKLSTLPIIGIRGYLAGYSFAKEVRPAWLETKSRLLESFLSSREGIDKQTAI